MTLNELADIARAAAQSVIDNPLDNSNLQDFHGWQRRNAVSLWNRYRNEGRSDTETSVDFACWRADVWKIAAMGARALQDEREQRERDRYADDEAEQRLEVARIERSFGCDY